MRLAGLVVLRTFPSEPPTAPRKVLVVLVVARSVQQVLLPTNQVVRQLVLLAFQLVNLERPTHQ